MSNNLLLYKIREYALNTVYWNRHAGGYYSVGLYSYAPMIKDDLFNKYFQQKDVVGVLEIEFALGRGIKVEELEVCPLSVDYLLWGNPIITGSEQERKILYEFADLIKEIANKNEVRAIGYELKRLQKLYKEYQSKK